MGARTGGAQPRAALSQAKRTGAPAELLDAYDDALAARNAIDFDDCVRRAVALLDDDAGLRDEYRARWRWVLVDEYQDVDAQQYRLIRLLVATDGNLCAIGDPDQAIYGFRGGDVRLFAALQRDYPGARVVRLLANYRSSAAIVGASSSLAGARAVATRTGGAPHVVVQETAAAVAEADFVARTIEQVVGGSGYDAVDAGRVDGTALQSVSFADFAVLYRTKAQGDAIAQALLRAGLPFQQRSHDVLAEHPDVAALVARWRDAPPRGAIVDALAAVGGPAVELLHDLALACGDDVERFLAEVALGAEVDALDPRADRIALLTLHAAKGLEYAVVFVVGCEDGLLPLRFGAQRVDLDEEKRLLYVGMTRARRRLYLTWARRRAMHGAVEARRPSPFLAEIEAKWVRRERDQDPSPAHRRKQLELF